MSGFFISKGVEKMDHVVIKRKLVAEIDVKPMSDTKLYKFILSIINDTSSVDNFLLAEGFTPGALNRIKKILCKSKNLKIN